VVNKLANDSLLLVIFQLLVT